MTQAAASLGRERMRVMRTPKTVDIDITDRCNLRCRYCYFFSSSADVKDLPQEEWLKFFEELNRCAVTAACLAGGEPFIRDDLKDILAGIVRNRMRFSILSNGTLINDDIAAFIASTRRCDYVQVSIDGSIPITHDSFRGKGSFYKAVEGIRCLQRNKVAVAVRVTIHRQNVHDLENIAKLLLEDIGLPAFSTNSAGYMGLCQKNTEQVQLSTEDRHLAMTTLLKLIKKYGERINATAGPLAEARGWREMEEARRRGLESLPDRGYLVGCGCTFDKIAVRADGAIVPCNMLSHIELGRINRDSLADIWQNHEAIWKIRERRAIPLSRFDFCRGCDYIHYCTGNCPALAYSLLGEVDHPSPDACLRKYLAEGGKLAEEAAD
ncbi:MAG: SynChlorMet cassette radical SAM/SPASM protein ScmE [Candidatus Aminicenantes bacterium]|nr:SynChlorMet cassette radical SAM/SPASM protein ScmE [Candidatus Aminicenantes bacterium]